MSTIHKHSTPSRNLDIMTNKNWTCIKMYKNVCKKRFGISPERHCLTAMPYRLFQGNLNPKDLKRHNIETQSFFSTTYGLILPKILPFLLEQLNFRNTLKVCLGGAVHSFGSSLKGNSSLKIPSLKRSKRQKLVYNQKPLKGGRYRLGQDKNKVKVILDKGVWQFHKKL